MKTYKLGSKTIIPVIEQYANNGALAIVLLDKDKEEYCVLTVNLYTNYENEKRAYIDINNHYWAQSFIIENKIGKPTGNVCKSGFCTYLEYEFELSKLNKREEI